MENADCGYVDNVIHRGMENTNAGFKADFSVVSHRK
jgi:hypothetical protein